MSDAARGSPVKGMIYGVLVDIGGSLLASFALFFVWAVWLGSSGMDAEAIARAMSEPDPLSAVSLVGYTVGTTLSWLGGFVCARVARETELQCAAVVATISALVTLATGSGTSFELYLFLVASTVAAVMLGGWMGKQRNGRDRTAAPA
jgi:hypothetical protein